MNKQILHVKARIGDFFGSEYIKISGRKAAMLSAGFFLLLLPWRPEQANVKHYEVRVAGIRVGHLDATRETAGNTTTYSLYSDVNIHIIKHYHITDQVSAVYENNVLRSAAVQTSIGGKNYKSVIKWNKDHYDIDINGYKYSKKGTEYKGVVYSIAKIYWTEPPAGAWIFSEDFGYFSIAEAVAPHVLQVSYEGKKDKFNYTSGDMYKADMQSAVRDYIISRLP